MAAPAGQHLPPVRVALGDRSYEIHIGAGTLADARRLISPGAAPGALFVITHPAVQRLHGEALRAGLAPLAPETILVPAGERHKTLRRAALLYDELLARGADRRSIIIAFGGGVVGDLAGFVAATYMRGIAYVPVPTTLLAQVDASVGGKVAVDHPQAKNLIGCFYQPRLVIADADTLRTLSRRDYVAGLAEVVKHGLIADASLFAWMEENASAITRRLPDPIVHMVRRSCEIKAGVIAQDERESGLRATLNLGHTVGHALETLTRYRDLRHGEAVAIGMVAAARLAAAVGVFPAADAERIERLLSRLGLPTRLPDVNAGDMVRTMSADKKSAAGRPRFVLPRAIGQVEFGREVPLETLRHVLGQLGAAAS
jgi:3-dehydroquinate synthase